MGSRLHWGQPQNVQGTSGTAQQQAIMQAYRYALQYVLALRTHVNRIWPS